MGSNPPLSASPSRPRFALTTIPGFPHEALIFLVVAGIAFYPLWKQFHDWPWW